MPKPETFFQHVDSLGVVETHIKEVLKLEDTEAKEILARYTEVRQQLVDRLAFLPRGSFSAQHLRGVLAQVQGAIIALNRSLNVGMVNGAEKAATKGLDHLLKELSVFDNHFTGAVTPINLNAAVLAHDTSQLLVTRYKTNLDAYGQGLFREISNGLFSATIGETSYDEVVGRIAYFFHGEEWKLHRIVRTELHGIYNRGKIAGMQRLVDDDTLPDLKKTLVQPMDGRTGDDSKYAAHLKIVVPIDKPFEYTWNGKQRVYYSPPDRPNDRSVMVPYREEWGKLQGPSFINF